MTFDKRAFNVHFMPVFLRLAETIISGKSLKRIQGEVA